MEALTEYQQKLVEENLDVVKQVLRQRIKIRGSVLLTYEDFYQVGCEALCRAAGAYRPDLGEFAPLAATSVYNAAIDHIRKQKLEASLRANPPPVDDDDDGDGDLLFSNEENTEQEVIDRHMIELISGYCDKYTGVTRLGVEAIRLKTLGYSNGDIAESYGTTANNVRAWITKARVRLRMDQRIMAVAQ